MPDFLFDTPEHARATLVLAHGSGQPMDSPFMTAIAARIAADRNYPVEVARFNFPYMARAVAAGRRRPPDRAAVLEASWRDAIETLRGRSPRLIIGGKSLGGRIASMIADDAGVDGVVCLGYPFHPPGKPERLRTGHLESIATSVLIVQGERDPFGNAAEVGGYPLSQRVRVVWLPDGDHGFKPRRSAAVTFDDNLAAAAAAAVAFIAGTAASG